MNDATGERPMRAWGVVPDSTLARPVIVSPHLDDAVLGCGQFMSAHAGATVVTVFAGNPERYPSPMRKWDVQSGFGPGDDVMAVRRAEDLAALAVLDARAVHLHFVEHTYNPGDRPVAAEAIAPMLREAIAAVNPTAVFTPFGLANPDHDATHRAALLARGTSDHEVPWFAYEDLGYAHIPGMLAWRVSQLFRSGLWPTKVALRVDESWARKLTALECYPTQLRALDDDWDLATKLRARPPECYWSLAPPPAGWERLAEV